MSLREWSAPEIAVALDLPKPTQAQIAVIESPLCASLVVAGAGSGKTETMAGRVLWLLANKHVKVSEILGLTFTRKAANELSFRIGERIEGLAQAGIIDREDVLWSAAEISTYNSFANKIFTQHALLLGVESNLSIITDASAWQLAREVVLQSQDERLIELDKSPDRIAAAVVHLSRNMSEHALSGDELERFVQRFQQLEDLPSGSKRVAMYVDVQRATEEVGALSVLVVLVEQYRQLKKIRGLVEYSDQVSSAFEVCSKVPEVAKQYREEYKVVLLDEYQDTSVLQTKLLARLFSDHPVMAVGDPHQSIYGWRGASAANLATFAEDFSTREQTLHFSLMTSWRNAQKVLECANVICEPLNQTSTMNVERLLPRTDAAEGNVEIAYLQDIVEEAEHVALWFHKHLKQASNQHMPTMALLCRSLKKIAPFTQALHDLQVPYHVVGLGGLLEEPAITDLVCALRVLHDARAESELVRLLSGANVALGVKDIAQLRFVAATLARQNDTVQESETVVDSLENFGEEKDLFFLIDAVHIVGADQADRYAQHFSDTARARIHAVSETFIRLSRFVAYPLLELVTLVWQELRLDIEAFAHPRQAEIEAHFEAFCGYISAYIETDEHATLATFLSWLEQAWQRDNLSAMQEEPSPGTVQILTIHAAKGLEWDMVAVARLAQGEFPASVRSKRGWICFGEIPYALRGDGEHLPLLHWEKAATQKEYKDECVEFEKQIQEHSYAEQRRLMYVAITRAKDNLLLTGSFWGGQKRARLPGTFLQELIDKQIVSSQNIQDIQDQDQGSRTLESLYVSWPKDFLGARADAVLRAKDAVFSAQGVIAHPALRQEIEFFLSYEQNPEKIHDDLDDSLFIPASHFSRYCDDPKVFLQHKIRPIPQLVTQTAQTGSNFHAWVQKHYSSTVRLDAFDIDFFEQSDQPVADAHLMSFVEQNESLEKLQEIFLRSEWALKKPECVEYSITFPLGAHMMSCQLDAVFIDANQKQSVHIIDWKTGHPPVSEEELAKNSYQLSLYRAAYSFHFKHDIEDIRASFCYIGGDGIKRIDAKPIYSIEELERKLMHQGV